MKTKNQPKCKALLAVCCMAALMLASCGKEHAVEVTNASISDCLKTTEGTKVEVSDPQGTYLATCVGNDIHVVRTEVGVSCGFDTVLVHVTYNEDTIKVLEEDHYPAGGMANCICTINMDYWLRDLPSGQFVLAFMTEDYIFYDTIVNLP